MDTVDYQCKYSVIIVLSVCQLLYYRPINLISETKDRWVYCAAFGMLANWFFQLTIGTGYSSTASSFSDAVYSGLCTY